MCLLVKYPIQKSLNYHSVMHVRIYDKENFLKCPMQGCKSSFRYESEREQHLRIHNNNLNTCRYCPYRYVEPSAYTRHLKMHFRIRDFECDQCGLKLTTKNEFTRHCALHEGIAYSCLICNRHETPSKRSVQYHFNKKHANIVGINTTWDTIKPHLQIKSSFG